MTRTHALVFLAVVIAATVSQPAQSASAEGELTGSIPPGGGIALAVWSGGPAADVVPAARARGCDLRSFWANHPGGGLVGYFPTRVSIVNEPFIAAYGDGVLPQMPLIVVCNAAAVLRTVVLPAGADNTLYEDPEGRLSNGSGAHLFVGSNDVGQARRSVIAFDLGQIPAGATVSRAVLRLHVSRTKSSVQLINVHAATAPWGEGGSDAEDEEGSGAPATTGDATWLHGSFQLLPWEAAGGDFEGSASATAAVDQSGLYEWESEGLTADVQAWFGAPGTNFGWVLVGIEGERRTTKRFDSREHPISAQRPALTVEYLLP